MNVPGGTGSGRAATSLGARFLLFSVVSLALMVLDHRDDHLSRLRQAYSVLVYPIQMSVNLPFKTWQWASISLADRAALLSENAELKAEQLSYNVRLQRMAALEAENTRLRAILDSSARLGDRVLVAQILSVDLDPYRQRFYASLCCRRSPRPLDSRTRS